MFPVALAGPPAFAQPCDLDPTVEGSSVASVSTALTMICNAADTALKPFYEAAHTCPREDGADNGLADTLMTVLGVAAVGYLTVKAFLPQPRARFHPVVGGNGMLPGGMVELNEAQRAALQPLQDRARELLRARADADPLHQAQAISRREGALSQDQRSFIYNVGITQGYRDGCGEEGQSRSFKPELEGAGGNTEANACYASGYRLGYTCAEERRNDEADIAELLPSA